MKGDLVEPHNKFLVPAQVDNDIHITQSNRQKNAALEWFLNPVKTFLGMNLSATLEVKRQQNSVKE